MKETVIISQLQKQKINISVGRLTKPIVELWVNESFTIKEVMSQLSASEKIYTSVSINGKKSTLDSVLKDGDLLVLMCTIRGEVTVRRNGKSWRIHANDPDNIFPSDFHAHNIETGETLDLYTRKLYDPRTKKLLAVLNKKDWKAILLASKLSKEATISSKAEIVLKKLEM